MDNRPVLKEEFAARLRQKIAEQGVSLRQLQDMVQISFSTLSRYASGQITPKTAVVYALAAALGADPVWLMGYESLPVPELLPAQGQAVPMLGQIAAGVPIYAEGQQQGYRNTASDKADFCLRVKGDSMVGARICDGDVVFIQAQPDVEDGEIAVVLIDDEATLKRVYKMGDRIVLRAENPAYPPMEFDRKSGKTVRILGKAIAFQGEL